MCKEILKRYPFLSTFVRLGPVLLIAALGMLSVKTAYADGTIDVETTTLDAVVPELNLNGPFLLKLDTHGYEEDILTGAEQTLQHCEVLVVEAYNFRLTGETLLFWELCGFLYQRGFRPVDIVDLMQRNHDDALWQMDLFFVRSSWPGFDYTAFE